MLCTSQETLASYIILENLVKGLVAKPCCTLRKYEVVGRHGHKRGMQLVGKDMPPLQSVKLKYQPYSQLRAAWTLT